MLYSPTIWRNSVLIGLGHWAARISSDWASDSPARTALASMTMASANWSSIFCRRRSAIRRSRYQGPHSRNTATRTAEEEAVQQRSRSQETCTPMATSQAIEVLAQVARRRPQPAELVGQVALDGVQRAAQSPCRAAARGHGRADEQAAEPDQARAHARALVMAGRLAVHGALLRRRP